MPVSHGVWTGTTPISLSASGLPAGVNFADNGNGTYTLSGVFPPPGSYPYTVTGTNAAGANSQPNNFIVATANAVNIDSFVNPALCAVATSPGCAQFLIQFRPNGEIWIGTNTAPISSQGQWHDGSVNGADYELRLTTVSGAAPTSGNPSVWLSMSVFQTFIYDQCAIVEDFNAMLFEVRLAATGIVQGQVQFCQQVAVDFSCSTC